MPNTLFLFVVVQNDDGSINVDTSVPEGMTVARPASQLDVLDATRKITADLDRQLIVSDVVQTLSSTQPTAEPSPAQRVQAALAARAAEQAATEQQVADATAVVDTLTQDAQKDDPEA